ncbi:hypothetical protein FGIG_07280 [Fasciola gigantica]|uniref:CCDC66 domain-containing protein n=1 Tax=Fasciola gigantica TaxID=46835 RepID=A0A504Z8F8_FASGI|nr:hypothetical protein FGIG_07280 [Fasciola gigantica]
MNFANKNVKKQNKTNGTARLNGSIKATASLGRNKKSTIINEKNKKDSKKAVDTAHVNSGVIGSKQLQSIYNLVGDVRQRSKLQLLLFHTGYLTIVPGDGKENQDVICSKGLNDRPLTKSDDEVISSVMQQIAELNRDKLSEESMVKVLTAVYLDAKAKIAEKSKSESALFTNRLDENSVQQPEAVAPTSQGENMPVRENTSAGDESGTPNRSLSISERKKIQWEKEKGAELEAMKVHDPWNKPALVRTTASTIVTAPSQAGPPLINLVSWSCSDQGTPVTASSTLPPALTPMAFATHEEAERARREEQRRQWKAELDQQVREQRMLQEKIRNEEQRKTEALMNEISLQQVNAQPFTSFQPASGNPGLSNNMIYPVSGPVTAHPSASHFASATFLPTTFVPLNPMSNASMQSTPAPNVPISVMPNVTFPSNSASFVGSTVSTTPSIVRTGFNRTRGFTQQIYEDSVESAERARLAHEARMENLRQIEEKQRRKEEEKAQRLLEEKLDEERLARERAEFKAIAQTENEERLRREEIERQQVQQLHANLLEARQAVERSKALHYSRHKQATAAGDFIQPTPRTISTGIGPTQTTPSATYSVPDQCQPMRPPDLPMFTATSVAAVPMMPAMPMAQPFANLLYLPTESNKTENVKRNLVPRCARETGPGRVGNKLVSAQSNDTKKGYSFPSRLNNTVKPRPTAAALKTNQRPTNTKSSIPNANTLEEKAVSFAVTRSTAATEIANKNSDRSCRDQLNEDGDYSQPVEGNSTAWVDADVVDTDYHRTTYTAPNPGEGFVPYHRPQSRQRRHTGFTPPPEMPEPPTKSGPNLAASVRRSAPSGQPVPTRIPVPTKQPSTVPRPTRLNPSSETPIHIQRTASHTVGPLDRVGYDSLDLVRTHDVLNPLEANSSLPISREPSASVQAREAYKKVCYYLAFLCDISTLREPFRFTSVSHPRFLCIYQSSNPALYGDPPVKAVNSSKVIQRISAPNTTNKKQTPAGNTQNDPILNPGLVKQHPTPRQDSILRHLSQIRQELNMKRELYESGNYDDEDD